MTATKDPQSLLRLIDAIWQEASAAFARLDDEQLATAIAGSNWCVKDVMAHFARWEDWHREAISEYLADGATRSYKGFSGWNDGWAAEDKDLSCDDARRRLETAHAQLMALLNDIPPDQWDDQVYAFAEQPTLNHMPEHLALLADRESAPR